ncbi:KTSC domain-containing protein [Niabella ginsengisoli]|uniref:KTSC domain-containing protein n=1 Tax=Niabella ginsengisoli TaxID=522298 RepID=A0ABS9SKJ0_9BACT|nr:KTSC domain-containing protein [Niabella ginsengisoli]MCH5598862.1 KTSC domain-containing protein [Niabella ginsengisoli]
MSTISHITHLPDPFRFRYISGSIYEYKDVPADIYEEMKGAFSKGQFLNAKIKGRYRYKKRMSNVLDEDIATTIYQVRFSQGIIG